VSGAAGARRGELLIGDLEGDRGALGDIALGIQSKLLRGDYDIFFRHDVSDGGRTPLAG